MSNGEVADEPPDTDRPKCKECGVEMWLRKVVKTPVGDHQVFECPVCEATAERP